MAQRAFYPLDGKHQPIDLIEEMDDWLRGHLLVTVRGPHGHRVHVVHRL